MKSYARHTNGKKIKVIQVKAVTPAQKKTLLEKAEKEQFIKTCENYNKNIQIIEQRNEIK